MYNKSLVKIIIGNIETSIDFKVGVKKGESMATVLFLFLIMAFSKILEDKWKDLGLIKAQFARKDKSPISTRKLVSNQPITFTSGTLFDIFCMVYVDDRAFVFEYSTVIKKCTTLLSNHFAHFGLKMHTGIKKTYKTEYIFFSPTGFFNAQNLLLTDLTNSTLALQNKKSKKKKRRCKVEKYTKYKETSTIKVKGVFVTFTKHFKYLGCYMSYYL